MALQTRIAELFWGGKKPESDGASEPMTAREAAPSLRSSAPPKPTSSGSEPAPRLSMTRALGERAEALVGRDGATPGSVLVDGDTWEQAAGGVAVDWWLQEGCGSAGSKALELVMAQLTEGSPNVGRWERTGDVRTVVAEVAPMLAVVEIPAIREHLSRVGLPPSRVNELHVLLLAFVQLEAPGASEDADGVSLVEQACALRGELLAACAWNLRGRRGAGTLARISDSVRAPELALDLTELADLITDNESAFGSDVSFDVFERTEDAVNLACKLRSREMQLSASAHECCLRGQVFSLLMDCVAEIQTAGVYALRHNPNWSRVFGPVRNVSRRRSGLRDALGT